MTYEGMEVADGQDAGLAWESLVRGDLDHPEPQRIKGALRAYCGRDTMAMVKLLGALRLGSRSSRLPTGLCNENVSTGPHNQR